MEPITFTAIVAALTAGAIAGFSQAAGENLFVDAYGRLKDTLKRKFGDESEVVNAVDNLEPKPDSTGRQGQLNEELDAAGADQDPDVRRAAQELLDQLKAQPGGETHIQNAVGNYIAQADRGSTATVNINRPEK